MSDAELVLVAEVCCRESWADITRPPEEHPPRTLAEEQAVQRYVQAAARRRARGRTPGLRAKLIVIGIVVFALGACWYVSPERTGVALLVAGVVSFVAHRRSRRRAHGALRRPRGVLGATR